MGGAEGPSAAPTLRRRLSQGLRRAFARPLREEPLVHNRLPLPPHLIALDSTEGEAMLADIGGGWDFERLAGHYVPQRNPRFCGPATLAILLNALHARATAPPPVYDQDTVFTPLTEAVKPREEVVRFGMGLPVFGAYLTALGADAEVCFAARASRDAFRTVVAPLLLEPDVLVAVNYHRRTLGQEGTGHISPLAAFHEESDRFLVLDVSRHSYPPVWVRTRDLFAAMNTVAGAHTRGFVAVGL